jgi:Ras-related protein Rab-1A
VKLQIWDPPRDLYGEIRSVYYRGAHAILVCFDLTDRVSFRNVRQWLGAIDRYACQHIIVLVVGCKADLVAEREVDFDTIFDFMELVRESREQSTFYNETAKKVEYVETSAKDGVPNLPFALAVSQVILKLKADPLQISDTPRKEKEKCCLM